VIHPDNNMHDIPTAKVRKTPTLFANFVQVIRQQMVRWSQRLGKVVS